MKIDSINLSHMHNDAHFSYYTEYNSLVSQFGAETLKIKPQHEILIKAFLDYDTAFKKVAKSVYTEKLHEADVNRDRNWHGIVETVKLALISYSNDIKSAAEKLKILLDSYGNIARKPYEEQTSAIHNVLQDLEEKYSAESQKCGINKWLELLQSSNENFKNLMMLRFAENAGKPSVIIRDIRHKVDDAYHAVVERINALIVIEGENNYREFVGLLNAVIKRHKDVMAQHSGRLAANDDKE